MSNNILLDKIDNVFNLLDNEQVLETDIILNLCNLIQTNHISLPDTSKQKLLHIIKKQLQTTNTELQRDSLTLLCHCFDVNLFDKEKLVSELLLIVIDGVFKKKIENLEEQELWLKALDALLKFTDSTLTPVFLKHSLDILEAIKLALSSKVNSSPKKLKVNIIPLALKLLGDIISKVDLDSSNTTLLLSILFTILIPSLFNEETKHFKITLDMAYKLIAKIPFSIRRADPHWPEFHIQLKSTYVPFMSKMLEKEGKLMYCQLWKFCLKLLDSDIHTNTSICNDLLSVLEKAFKVKPEDDSKRPKFEITKLRKEAFIFWQDFIQSFLILSNNKKLSTHKIMLLMTPLMMVSTLSITIELFYIKYQTWCTLVNMIHKLNIYPKEFLTILTEFLDFSFGPTSGKKVPILHLKISENFFKTIASKELLQKYIPVTKYDIICDNPMIDTDLFLKLHVKITKSVEDASILLNGCLENKNEANKLNGLLWNAIFDLVENAAVKDNKIVQEFYESLEKYFEVPSETKQKVTPISIETILNLIVSEKYSFCKVQHKEKTLFELIVSKLFRDLKHFYTLSNSEKVLELILQQKKNHPQYLSTLDLHLNHIKSLAQQNPDNKELITNLFNNWKTIGNETLILVLKNKNNIPINVITTFSNMMIWALDNIHLLENNSSTLTLWKSYLDDFKFSIGENNTNINSICCIFAKTICAKDFNLTSSEIFLNIIRQLCFKKGMNADSRNELLSVLNNFKELTTKDNHSNEIIDNLKKCLELIFLNQTSKVIVGRIMPALNEIVKNLIKNYPTIDFTEMLNKFTVSYNPGDKTKTLLQEIIEYIFKDKDESVKSESTSGSVFSDSTQKLGFMEGVSVISEKGMNELTPSRIKVPPNKPLDDEFIFVNTPYSFNPKKLTKSQKEKFSKRRDDIPAMYNDLSQSKTMEFSNSSSNFDSHITTTPKTDSISTTITTTEESVSQKRAFSEISNNTENEKPENDNDDLEPKKRQRTEIKRLEMSNTMGFEEHLQKSAELPIRYTRNRTTKKKKDSNISPDPQQKRRGRPSRKQENFPMEVNSSQNTILLTQSSPDLLNTPTQNENTPTHKKQTHLEDFITDISDSISLIMEPVKNTKFKFHPSAIGDKITTELKKDNFTVVLDKPRLITRRNSLESANLDSEQIFRSQEYLENGYVSKKRRNSMRDEIINDENKKVPKIKLLRSPNEEKSFIIENKLKPIEEEVPETQTQNENDKETESISSEMFSDVPVNNEEYPNANNSICRKVLFDKSVDSDETNVDSSIEKPQSPPKEPTIEIVTSPLRHDTPTRNKEFLDDTLEISPIKNTSQRNLNLDTEKSKPDSEKSPDLFSNIENSEKEVVISECSTPTLPKRKIKFNSKGRIAQMMNLINPNGCKINDVTPTKDDYQNSKSEVRISTPIISNSRISKMMGQFDNKYMDRIEENETPPKKEPTNEEDFLRFTKIVPLPTASPRFGILRKRKHPDEPEEGISPCTKKKRVNFNDPPFTSLKFIEKYHNIRNRSSTVLFSTTADRLADELIEEETGEQGTEEPIGNMYNKKKITVIDSASSNTIAPMELQSNQFIELNGIQEKTKEDKEKSDVPNDSEMIIEETESPLSQETEIISNSTSEEVIESSEECFKLYEKHTMCTELLSSCLDQTEENEKLISILKDGNLKTMGEFTKFVIEDPKILTKFKQIKNILDSHNCNDHLNKVIRKIKPTTLSSPRKAKIPIETPIDDLSPSQNTPSIFDRNVTESQENCTETHSELPSLKEINDTCLVSSGSLDWNKLFCNIIGADEVVKLLLKQESMRETNFVSVIKFISSYDPQKFFETLLNILQTPSIKKYFVKFIPDIFKSLSFKEVQDIFIARLKLSYENKETITFSPELFDKILNSSKDLSVILQNPSNNKLILQNLSLCEIQDHLIERLTIDSFENKETFLNRLNDRLGNKLKIVNNVNSDIISDSLKSQESSLEVSKTNSLRSAIDVIKSLNNVSNEDLLVLHDLQNAISNLFFTHLINKQK